MYLVGVSLHKRHVEKCNTIKKRAKCFVKFFKCLQKPEYKAKNVEHSKIGEDRMVKAKGTHPIGCGFKSRHSINH